MKNYNISELKVIEVTRNELSHYFICEQGFFPNLYKEIFTGKKLIVSNPNNIEELSNYYSILVGHNHETKETLKLTKELLIAKYADINAYHRLEKYQKENNQHISKNLDENTVKILEQATLDFFPESGRWSSECFRKTKDSLLCNLRNNNWLATKLQVKQGLENVDFNDILYFVETSSFFRQQRHNYEQKVVKLQIEWMKNNDKGWINNEDCDLYFRQVVVDTLISIGIDYKAIEEGIETNAHMWLDTLMLKAYENKYEISDTQIDNEETTDFHKQLWLKLRKYEYYQRHRKSVDDYGIITPDMKIQDSEVKRIKEYLQDVKENKNKIKKLTK